MEGHGVEMTLLSFICKVRGSVLSPGIPYLDRIFFPPSMSKRILHHIY
jgi:hypothetical protein